jgi:uncharacterized protein (TIGR02678 family)
MPLATPAAHIQPSDLGSYQSAVRLVLTYDVITAARPRPGTLAAVLRWADQLSRDLRDVLGYTLIATTRQVRLVRRLDALDPTQATIFTARSGRPFDRRRLAYLCLCLASFSRSRTEISLADLVRTFTPTANAIDGLGFHPTVGAHKAAVVDVLDWLAERGALRLSDGSVEAWTADTDRGDALYDIDHDICAVLFRPARPVQHLTSAAGLLDATLNSAQRAGQREAAAQHAARALAEHPVVYYAQVEPEVAEALRQPDGVAENLARLTGLAVERRAEGVLLADAGGRFTDRPFPGRGGAVNRAAGLLLAKIADVLEDPDQHPPRLPLPPDDGDQRDLLERIDAAIPLTGVVAELAWSAPGEGAEMPAEDADEEEEEEKEEVHPAQMHDALPVHGPAVSGNGSAVSGNGSTVRGNGSAVRGNGSTVPGNGSSVPGNGSAVRGNGSAVSGYRSAVPGDGSAVSSIGSAISGYRSAVSGNGSTATFVSPEAARRPRSAAAVIPPRPLVVPFLADSRLSVMIEELYDELGPASFTVTWQHDPHGLRAAAVAFLADLRLLRPVAGGVLVLPAAARYRNIKLALPVRHAEGQLALDLFGGADDE